VKAVILVAGVSRRLYPLTEHRPKCLLEVGGKTILDHQLDALRANGVSEVCLVLGYRREQILDHVRGHHADLEITTRVNHHFFDTNTAVSLWAAGEEFLDRDFVYLNGDVLFEPRLIERVLSAAPEHPTALAVERKPCGDEEVKVELDDTLRIRDIGKQLDPGASAGEFIGVGRFEAPITAPFFDQLDRLVRDGQRQAYFEAALEAMAPKHPLHAVDVTDLPCIEIDFPEDYEAARKQVLARFSK
jgi:choline kinase